MSFLYRHQSEYLGVLLEQAGSGSAPATLLIPDLQRPYVWKPQMIVVLVDSLLRGWPFGSLLLWNYGQDRSETVEMPHRRFWREVDRTTGDGGTDVPAATLPASTPFRMVLDGQQRVQSLLLAVGGDDWGLKLTDRQWSEAFNEYAPRGRKARPSWTRGQLCLNVTKYLVASSQVSPRQVNYEPLLAWVNTLSAGGTSPALTTTAKSALPQMREAKDEYVRLSRLWSIASLADQEERFSRLESLLPGRPPTEILRLTNFISRLEAVRNTPVSMLEVTEKPADLTAAQYQDAIVNIFSRLNTQGRALSEEDITFAWIKAAWPQDHPVQNRVREEFEGLRTELEGLGVKVTVDALVQAAATAWSVLDRDDGLAGSVLARGDLVKGSVMRGVVAGIAARWSAPNGGGMRETILWMARRLDERALHLGDQYLSYNSLLVLWTWGLVSEAWLNKVVGRSTLAIDQFWRAVEAILDRHVDRWLTVPSWAGTWSDGVEVHTKTLATLWQGLRSIDDDERALESLEAFFTNALDAKMLTAAKAYVDGLKIDRRDRVRDYYIPLWFWTRLDDDRWEVAKEQLSKAKSRARPSLHVDHVVPYAWWDKHPSEDDEVVDGNDLGNCMILDSNFNLAKSDTPAAVFLTTSVNNFKHDVAMLGKWSKALLIPEELLDATKASTDAAVREAVAKRTTAIRDELKGFIDGARARRDR
ncbi:MAG: DUF262 domain-containing protein [Polyangiaceae bacterium]